MTRPAADFVLQDRIETARQQAKQPLSREEVAEIVSSVLGSMGGEISQHDLKVYSELEALARYILNARREIALLQPADIHEEHIPRATDELDAVVEATEDATNRIMDSCDQIMAIAGEVSGESSMKLMDITTNIYEACNFQDITGQRITKVVRALKHIESKVEGMLLALGEEVQRRHPNVVEEVKKDMDEKFLLNGPQLPGSAAVDQAFIDSLFD
jgi:chemotaxis protein CheZ